MVFEILMFVAASLFAGAIAGSQSGNGLLGAILGLLVGPFGAIAAALLRDTPERRSARERAFESLRRDHEASSTVTPAEARIAALAVQYRDRKIPLDEFEDRLRRIT